MEFHSPTIASSTPMPTYPPEQLVVMEQVNGLNTVRSPQQIALIASIGGEANLPQIVAAQQAKRARLKIILPILLTHWRAVFQLCFSQDSPVTLRWLAQCSPDELTAILRSPEYFTRLYHQGWKHLPKDLRPLVIAHFPVYLRLYREFFGKEIFKFPPARLEVILHYPDLIAKRCRASNLFADGTERMPPHLLARHLREELSQRPIEELENALQRETELDIQKSGAWRFFSHA